MRKENEGDVKFEIKGDAKYKIDGSALLNIFKIINSLPYNQAIKIEQLTGLIGINAKEIEETKK